MSRDGTFARPKAEEVGIVSWLQASNPVTWWWVGLVSIATVNIIAWALVRRRSLARLGGAPADALARFDRVVGLSGLYVFGCAFRSVLPRADVQRICLWDTWFSNVFVGRSVATVAELSFVIQGALVLHFIAGLRDSRFGQRVAVTIVALITIAECCSWYAVLTTNYLGNTCEESLWTVSYTLVGVALAAMAMRAKGSLRGFLIFGAVGCAVYVSFMLSTDVPMYLNRFLADQRSGRGYLDIGAGAHDLLTRWVVTHDLTEWRTEIPWMTLYFSFAVWLSIALCSAPMTPAQLSKLSPADTEA